MKRSKEYLKSFVDRIIMETLSEKADKVMGKLKNAPSSFDYVEDIDLELDEARMEDEKGNVIKPEMSGMTNEDECNECGTMYEIELEEGETCECGGSIYGKKHKFQEEVLYKLKKNVKNFHTVIKAISKLLKYLKKRWLIKLLKKCVKNTTLMKMK